MCQAEEALLHSQGASEVSVTSAEVNKPGDQVARPCSYRSSESHTFVHISVFTYAKGWEKVAQSRGSAFFQTKFFVRWGSWSVFENFIP